MDDGEEGDVRRVFRRSNRRFPVVYRARLLVLVPFVGAYTADDVAADEVDWQHRFREMLEIEGKLKGIRYLEELGLKKNIYFLGNFQKI